MPARADLFAKRLMVGRGWGASAGVWLTRVVLVVGMARIAWCAERADYLLDLWDNEKGLPHSSVTAIAQTPDGYLWVGTYDGLARFDGIRFTTFNTPPLSHARIQGLEVDSSGTLWINTYRGGLISYRDRVFRQEWPNRGEFDMRTTLAKSASNEVVFVTQTGVVLKRLGAREVTNAVWTTLSPPGGARLKFGCADGAGRLWFLTREGRISRLEGAEFRDLGADCGLERENVRTLAADAKGRVWAGTDQQVAVWDGRRFQTMTPTNGEEKVSVSYLLPTRDAGAWVLADGRLRKQLGRRWILEAEKWRGLLGWASGRGMGMHEDRVGGVWFNHYGNGLFHVTPEGKFQRFTPHEGLPGGRIWSWFEDQEGNVWAGVDRGGLVRLRDRVFQIVGLAEGLPARAALSVCQDETGTMWFGTSGGGLCRWQEGEAQTFVVGSDPSDNLVFSVLPQPGQGLWLSAAAGEDLYRFSGGKIERAALEIHGVKALLADRTGRVWMGTKTGVAWFLGEQRRIFGTRDGLGGSAVRALVEDRQGGVWCGSDEGTLYRCRLDQLQPFRPADGLASQPIWALLADSEGAVWAGTFGGGLLRFKDGKFARLTMDQGLPSDAISQLLEDGHGQLWLGTLQGICRVSKAEVVDCVEGRARRVDCVTYGKSDGLPTLECASNYQPACWKGADGRLWFATGKGVVWVKPDDLRNNPVPPPVAIEEMRVDGERFALGGGPLAVPPGRKQIEFRYTAPSFTAPDRVRFRYRLEGWDGDWVEADTRRVVQYTRLPSRAYSFQVRACNGDGKWNETGSTVAFEVLPHFYERWWFLTLAGLALIGGVAALVRAATMRKYRRELARLEQQHAVERDRARIAQDIHDDLGAGLTQITLLSELARREPAQAPEHLDHISESARKMTRAMDEIVWAVDPQHDTLGGFMDYASAYTEEFLRAAGIRCRMDLPAALPAGRLEAEARYNLFLALKEALNNVVKHAQATEVRVRVRFEPRAFTLIVEDNGRGFEGLGPGGSGAAAADRVSTGHGLANLARRLVAAGGVCRVQSAPGQGTRVELAAPISAAASPVLATDGNKQIEAR